MVHAHAAEPADRARERALRLALALTLGFAAVEAAGGWLAGSLALLADAFHMLSDGFALALAWSASRLSLRPPSARMSYGWRRAEVLAALINVLLMLALVAGIAWAAVERIAAPRPVAGETVIAIAVLGLAVNLLVLRILHRADRGALNTRAARLHVLGDLAGSLAALAAGLIVWLTGWLLADPLLGILIAGLIGISALRLLAEVLGVLLDAVPRGVDLAAVERELCAVPGVRAVHDLHVWSLAGDRRLLSAHVELEREEGWSTILPELQARLTERFGIRHATLQAEPPAYRAEALAACRRSGCELDDHRH
jgi:cobalt-zinc-cadmium efflux system protein